MIYTVGETVIDLIFKNMQPQAAKVGGSALNTSVSLGRLGNEVAFISEIGSDELGEWCLSFLNENGVTPDAYQTPRCRIPDRRHRQSLSVPQRVVHLRGYSLSSNTKKGKKVKK